MNQLFVSPKKSNSEIISADRRLRYLAFRSEIENQIISLMDLCHLHPRRNLSRPSSSELKLGQTGCRRILVTAGRSIVCLIATRSGWIPSSIAMSV
jgi:hypothetical protein